jgi:DNA-binding MltR family transcriptional regulator
MTADLRFVTGLGAMKKSFRFVQTLYFQMVEYIKRKHTRKNYMFSDREIIAFLARETFKE